MFYVYVHYSNQREIHVFTSLYKVLFCYPSIVIGKDNIEVFKVCFTYMSSIVTRKEYMYLQACTMCCLSSLQCHWQGVYRGIYRIFYLYVLYCNQKELHIFTSICNVLFVIPLVSLVGGIQRYLQYVLLICPLL